MEKDVIIIVLSISLVFCIYLILKNRAAKFKGWFTTPFENSIAKDGIDAYRAMWAGSIYKKTKVIFFTEKDINDYMSGPYKTLTKNMGEMDEYKWVVGFYLKRENNKDGNPRNSFYVIPTRVKMNATGIITDYIDYYDDINTGGTNYDDHSGVDILKQKSAYDAGQLWP